MPTEPITADNIYINGNTYRATDSAWLGLDFSDARQVSDSRAIVSNVLHVRWVHPEDKARGIEFWATYHVRPRNIFARFQKTNDQWHLVTE